MCRGSMAAAVETLEAYVQGGGGLAIFVGPDVNTGFYNQALYKDGKGLLPAPLGLEAELAAGARSGRAGPGAGAIIRSSPSFRAKRTR